MSSGGVLDVLQDLRFKIQHTFKVGELKQILKELVAEGRISLTAKEIRSLKKPQIIDMVVQDKLSNPPKLSVSVAISKKYKVKELKHEALEHAKSTGGDKATLSNIRKMKKAELVNYIVVNNLWQNPESVLTESVPTGNPKLQMKGITIGSRTMPRATATATATATPEIAEQEGFVKPNITDEEMSIMRRNKFWNFTEYVEPFKQMQNGKIPLHYTSIVADRPVEYTLVDKRIYVYSDKANNPKDKLYANKRLDTELAKARKRYAKIDSAKSK